MKAQHRKELQTNALADRIGRFLQSAKTGPSRTTVVIWSLILLAIAVLAGWLAYDYYAKKENSALTRELEEASTRKAYKDIADAHPNTPAGRMALMQFARMALHDGLDHLYAGMPDERAAAKEDIEKARDAFEKLAKDFKDTPALAQEALLSAAKARESLGDFDGALHAYQQAAQSDKDSYLGKQAEARANDLGDPSKRKEIESFYQAMDKYTDYKPQGPREP
jgi:predicted negative regulator of RcsB-dependent stress response